MLTYVLRRVLLGLLALWAVATLIFISTLFLPGDAARALLGDSATPEQIAVLQERMGLNRSPVERYFEWLGGLLVGNLGASITSGAPVVSIVGPAALNSIVLVTMTALIAFPLALAIGIYSAWRKGTRADGVISFAVLVAAAMPEFVVGFLLLYVFSTGLSQLLPATALSIHDTASMFANPLELVLPIATLVVVVLAYGIRMSRATMIDVLDEDYVKQARLNGFGDGRILLRTGLRNAIGPVIQVFALQFAWMIGGVVIVEYIFNFPGLGKGLIDAVNYRDLPLVQGFTLLVAAAYIALNILSDVVVLVANPQSRAKVAAR